VAFKSFIGVSDAARAIQDFLFDRDAALPDAVREKLRDLVGPTASPVDAVVKGAEILYGRINDIEGQALKLGAGLALIAEQYNFHGMALEHRGSRIAQAFMREASITPPEGVTYPDKEDDPEVKSEYMTQEVA